MMMRVMVVLLVLVGSIPAWAGQLTSSTYVVKDNRYVGFEKPLSEILNKPVTLDRVIKWPTVRPNLDECAAGEYYEPVVDARLKGAAKAFGKARGLYSDATGWKHIEEQKTDHCVWMRTRHYQGTSWRYVRRRAGVKYATDEDGRPLFDLGVDGKGCWNARPYHEAFVEKVKPEKPAEVIYREQYEESRSEPEPRPKSTWTPPADEKKSVGNWGLTASAMLGRFDSRPISGFASQISGREICDIRGRTFDVGIARRNEGPSFWRFTLASKSIDDGSYTQYDCPRCETTVVTTAYDAQVWGGKIERVQAFGPKRWKVHPAIMAHVGVGKISGEADQITYHLPSGQQLSHRVVGADQLIGSSAFPIAGGGIGITSDISSNLTLSATFAGFEYPGVFYGGVYVTFWP